VAIEQLLEALQERVAQSELGRGWTHDPLLQQDIWLLTELGYGEEQCKLDSTSKVYFERLSLSWLKYLAKVTIKARARERSSITVLNRTIGILRQFDNFLTLQGYTQPEDLCDSVLQEFIAKGTTESIKRERIIGLSYIIHLWSAEGWLKIPFIPPKYERPLPKIEVVPEEVLHKVYEHFDLFPPMLERLFRLQLALGSRIGEMRIMPRQCLKQEGEHWFLLRWIEKRKKWQFFGIHSLVAELVQEQQRFLVHQFGANSDFDKLFCSLSTSPMHRPKRISGKSYCVKGIRFKTEPVYRPELLARDTLSGWLRAFSEAADLQDEQNNRFYLTSHMFRRTKASIMAYCETEDEYIAAMLGHASLDMLPHYRKRSFERWEREVQSKGYVDMHGRNTTFKPKKQRYEKLAELLKVTTPLGECHRPTMLGDCRYRYACYSCAHHRVTLEDKPHLEVHRDSLMCDLQQAQIAGQERRVTEISRLLELTNNRLKGLDELKNLQEQH
jgi:integrase